MRVDKTQAHQAEVRLREQRVGHLFRRADQKFLFQYDPAYFEKKEAIAIASSLPLEKKEFLSEQLHLFSQS